MEYLEHHGIRGMKWGIRNYQNQDGSLTPAGRERYGIGKVKGVIKKAKEKAGLKAYEAKVLYGRPALRDFKSSVRSAKNSANRIADNVRNADVYMTRMGNKLRNLSPKHRMESEAISRTKQMLYRSKKQMAKINIARNIKQQIDYKERYKAGKKLVYKIARAKRVVFDNSNSRFYERVHSGSDYLGALLYSGQAARGAHGSYQERLSRWVDDRGLKDPYDTIGRYKRRI